MSGKSLNKSDIIKLKFGVNDLKADIKYFKKIQSDFPVGTRFRLDANNSYDVDDAQSSVYSIIIDFRLDTRLR